jgi:HK97 family phage portal protein
MAILNDLMNIFKKVDVRYQSTYQNIGGIAVYPDANADNFLKAYYSNASIYAIINFVARKFSVIPHYVLKEENEDQVKKYKLLTKGDHVTSLRKASLIKNKAYSEKKSNTGLDDLVNNPNPTQGQDAFLFTVYAYYKILGESFIWLNRGETNQEDTSRLPVLEMYVLPPNLVNVIPDKDDIFNCIGYQLNINGRLVYINKSDILHWRTYNPMFNPDTRDHLRGLSPLRAGNKILSQDEDSTDAAVAMYQNGGARGVLFEKSLRQITAQQKASIEEITAKRINNKDLKSSIANLQGEWGYLDIGKDSVDMQLLEGNDKAFAKLCHLFGVPPGMFLIDQTYENMKSNRKRFVSEVIIPDCTSFSNELNRVLLPSFGLKGFSIEPDFSELPEMQEDVKDMVTYLKESPVTLNEFREALGYDPLMIDGMDTVYINSGLRAVDEDLEIQMPDYERE